MLCSGFVYVVLVSASCGTELAAYVGCIEQLSAVLAGAERLLIVCHCFGECEVDHRLKRIILAQQVQTVHLQTVTIFQYTADRGTSAFLCATQRLVLEGGDATGLVARTGVLAYRLTVAEEILLEVINHGDGLTEQLGSLASGVVEIYGTENRLLIVYPVAAAVLLVASLAVLASDIIRTNKAKKISDNA